LNPLHFIADKRAPGKLQATSINVVFFQPDDDMMRRGCSRTAGT
jgi:hypothetical protein